jgi:hypothetical protein
MLTLRGQVEKYKSVQNRHFTNDLSSVKSFRAWTIECNFPRQRRVSIAITVLTGRGAVKGFTSGYRIFSMSQGHKLDFCNFG